MKRTSIAVLLALFSCSVFTAELGLKNRIRNLAQTSAEGYEDSSNDDSLLVGGNI